LPSVDVPLPHAVFVQPGEAPPVQAGRAGDLDGTPRWTASEAEVRVSHRADGSLAVHVACPRELSRVVLRWRHSIAPGSLLMGDAWERSYGDLQWRPVQAERVLPWYWLAHDPATGQSRGAGVEVRPAAFCAWTVDPAGVSLWLDLRNGGGPVRLGDRSLHAATVHAVRGGPSRSPWQTTRELCRFLAPEPPLPTGPVVGCNNWYYAYGRDFDEAAVLRDAETIAGYADGHPVRPYCTVDAGWSPGGTEPGGPWTGGLPGVFDDMAATAARIAERGARPGLWFRPLLSRIPDPCARGGPAVAGGWPLDPSRPETLARVAEDVRRITGWGFELVKHDFSSYDLFGRFGPAMGAQLTEPGWHLHDRSRTNAEVLLGLYRTIHEAAGRAVVIGCNTVGHLAAGLVQLQRTGDDTSGRVWERTRRMGINTLAFRLPQHRVLFTVDADCIPCTPATDWALNRQFLDLVARSGTALFVSVDPAARSGAVDADLRAAVRTALDGGEPGGIEPVDWLADTAPRHWRSAGRDFAYTWDEPWGSSPLPV
jgi:alpha-galactosidase